MASRPLAMALALTWTCTEASGNVLTFPGPGACSASFNNCMQAAAVNDTIEIATDSPISGPLLSTTKALTIRPAPGFRPTFAEGVTLRLSVQAGQGGTIRVEGLRFQRGSLVVDSFAPVQVDLLNNHIESIQDSSYSAGIWIIMPGQVAAGTGAMHVDISGNTIQVDGGANSSGIFISRSPSPEEYPYQLRVTDNRIIARGSSQENGSGLGRTGIVASDDGGIDNPLRIERNQILEDPDNGDGSARFCSGIRVNANQQAATTARIANNLMVLKPSCSSLSSGIWLNGHPDNLVSAHILNNTIVAAQNGIRLGSTGWPNSPQFHFQVLIANNLIRDAPGFGVVVEPLAADSMVSNQNNAWFQVAGYQNFSPAPGSITSDPQSLPPRHRLSSTSPLRETGDAAVYTSGLTNLAAEALDADGLRRTKSSQIDIGAFEFGDATYRIDFPTSNPSVLYLLDVAGLNGFAQAMLHLTRSDGRNLDGYVGVPNPLSTYYEVGSQRWHVRSEDGNVLPPGGGLNLWAATPGSTADQYFVGLNSLTEPNAALLPDAWASLPSDYLFLVAPTRGVGNVAFVDTHPVAARQVNGQWHLSNTDGVGIEIGNAFVVYAQAPGHNAYVHTVSDANRLSGTVSRLDHPLLNGLPCAGVHVGVNGSGLMPTRDVSAHYDSNTGFWQLHLEAIGPMLFNGNRYNILIDPRPSDDACRVPLLTDGFEGN
ncbi:hypothetical protein C7S18_02235 [Ahniella affigens]|uniref:DUF7452 domain-containing protein n=2 Tax=Ahniella affigens TaxID=2021234 RepID=A0A2P1PMM1_9GAMM|nr:hypothetical protein C7S18_02235 [Ahniella affigens]